MRILFGWELGAGMGHLSPHRYLFEALVARGHELHIAALDIAKAARAFRGLGVKLWQAPVHRGHPEPLYEPTPTLAHVLHNSGFDQVEHIAARAVGWDQLLTAIRPELVLTDYAPVLLLAMRGRSTATACLSSGFFTPPPVRPLPVFWTLVGRLPKDAPTSDAMVLERINQVLESRGQAPVVGIADLFHEQVLCLLQTYPELDHYPERPGAAYLGTPPAPRNGRTPDWPSGKGPKVYGYLKPTRGLPQALAEVANLGWPTLIVGDGLPAGVRERLTTKTLQFVTEPLDLHEVAKSCDVVMHNGNHATASQFLSSGIPSLSLPIFLEQQLIAANLQRLGAGLFLGSKSGRGAAQSLRRLLQEPSYRRANQAFRQRHEPAEPDEYAARVIAALQDIAPV